MNDSERLLNILNTILKESTRMKHNFVTAESTISHEQLGELQLMLNDATSTPELKSLVRGFAEVLNLSIEGLDDPDQTE